MVKTSSLIDSCSEVMLRHIAKGKREHCLRWWTGQEYDSAQLISKAD